MRHALVTGGAGFIGSHLVDLLLQEGWRVTVIDNFDPFYNVAIKLKNIDAHLRHPLYKLIECDIRDRLLLEKLAPPECDVVVHLAARAGVRPSIADPIGYQEVNLNGTQNLLEAVRARCIKQFVFGSSSSVYGVNPHTPWSEEDAGLRPISPYASSKLSAEFLGHVYSKLHGIRFLALRFFTVYGPRQRPDLAIHKFARAILTGNSIPVYGNGRTRRDYTHVSDFVRGIRGAIDYQASDFEAINLGNNQTIELRQLIAALEKAANRTARLETLPEQPGDVPQTWADIRKAGALLNYHPSTSIEEGIPDFVSWLRGTLAEQDESVLVNPVPASSALLTTQELHGTSESGHSQGDPEPVPLVESPDA